MVENDVAAELATLRTQLENLERQRVQRESPAPVASTVGSPELAKPAAEAAGEAEDNWLDGLENLEPEQILERLKAGARDWFEDLDNELKDTKPSTRYHQVKGCQQVNLFSLEKWEFRTGNSQKTGSKWDRMKGFLTLEVDLCSVSPRPQVNLSVPAEVFTRTGL